LPLIDKDTIATLISKRDMSKVATVYATQKTKLPEPLVAIWEPKGLIAAINYMNTAKSSCPRKFLINSDIKLIHPTKDDVLYNANSLADLEYAKSKLT
jgi:molybdopterin-guanine dinucleotide biosynthesis protein A